MPLKERLVAIFINALAAIGLAMSIVITGVWATRDELVALYRSLPVVVAAKHCPGSTQ